MVSEASLSEALDLIGALLPPNLLPAPAFVPVPSPSPSVPPVLAAEQTPGSPTPATVPLPASAFKWSHFESDFFGRPAEDPKAHLLGTNDWMI